MRHQKPDQTCTTLRFGAERIWHPHSQSRGLVLAQAPSAGTAPRGGRQTRLVRFFLYFRINTAGPEPARLRPPILPVGHSLPAKASGLTWGRPAWGDVMPCKCLSPELGEGPPGQQTGVL